MLHYFVNDHVIFSEFASEAKLQGFSPEDFCTIFIERSLNVSIKRLSSTIVLPLSVSIISFCVWQFLLVRKGSTKLQNDLFVTRPFLVTSWKYDLMHFLPSETHLFLWVLNKTSFSLDGSFQNLFLRRIRLYISFLNSLLMKGAWFSLNVCMHVYSIYSQSKTF